MYGRQLTTRQISSDARALDFAERTRHRRVRRHARQVRARRDRAGRVAPFPSGARHLRPAPGRRPDAAHQDSAGDRRPASQMRALAGVASQILARLLSRHHAAEHPVPLRPAERLRDGDARARRRRADHAGSVRQLGPQHHRLPVRRNVATSEIFDVTPVRRSADAVLPAPSAQRRAAAQVQDRLRRLRRGSRARRRSTTSACAPGSRTAPRLPGDRGRRHVDPAGVGLRALRVHAGRRDARAWRRRSCACSTSSATTSIGSATA